MSAIAHVTAKKQKQVADKQATACGNVAAARGIADFSRQEGDEAGVCKKGTEMRNGGQIADPPVVGPHG